MLTNNHLLVVIFLMALITLFFRVFPFYFIEFIRHHSIVLYLGKTLPAAIMLILVFFSLKDINFINPPYGMPEIATILFVIILHITKRNFFFSIIGGIIFYAILLKFIIS